MKGGVQIIFGAGAVEAVILGQPVVVGAIIATGADGTVVLARRGDSITVFPDSRISIPADTGGEEPGILQSVGKLLFRMSSRESRDFEVDTPYLIAAIKGTTFTVEVTDGKTSVNVHEGLVQVTATVGGQTAYARAGQTAVVNGDDGGSIRVSSIDDDDDDDDGGGGSDNRDHESGGSGRGTNTGTDKGTGGGLGANEPV